MNLDDIPGGSLCVLDTNVLLYAEQGVSAQAQRLLRRIGRGEVLGLLPQPVWQELTHKLMLAEALRLWNPRGSTPPRQLADKPEVTKRLKLYREKVEALVTLGLKFEPCTQEDLIERGCQLQAEHGLTINEAVILAVALRLKADALAAADGRFPSVKELKVYYPSDLTPSPAA